MNYEQIIPKAIKIALLGDIPVGKSVIYNVFENNEDNEDIHYNSFHKEKMITLKNGEEIKIILYDTNGQERFRSAIFKTIRNVNGVILVFALDSRSSFDNLDNWLSDIKKNLNNPYIILFGNKSDLSKEKWQVTQEEINKYVEEKGFAYFETSAYTKKGIMEGITYMANEIYDKMINKHNENIIIKEKDTKKLRKKTDCVKSKK